MERRVIKIKLNFRRLSQEKAQCVIMSVCSKNKNPSKICVNDNGKMYGNVFDFDFDMDNSLTDKHVKQIYGFIQSKCKTLNREGLIYKELDNDAYICFDLCRCIMIRCNVKKFKKFLAERSHFKLFTYKNFKICVKTPLNYVSEGVLDIFRDGWAIIANCTAMISQVGPLLSRVATGMQDKEVGLWMIDLMAIFAELVDPYSYGLKRLILLLARIYTLVKRFVNWKKEYIAESFIFDSLHDVALAFAAIGLPQKVVDIMKNFTFLTGTKFIDTSLFMHCFSYMTQLLHGIFEWIHSLGVIDISSVLHITSNVKMYGEFYFLIKDITTLYTKYVKNAQVMIDADFRRQVLEINEKSKSAQFMEYVNNDSNRFFKPLYTAFKDNVVRYAETFDVSSKSEPICIVFSGPPGCGKSVLMNSLVDYLKNKRSVYVHSTPPVDSGKDFYDDYQNQDIFVMDDVGQQGPSQWRQIINFVSPVKYPLECAAAEKKNTKFFNSKIILCTTNNFRNLKFTTTDGISDTGALFRRVHLFECTRDKRLSYMKYNYQDDVNRWESSFIEPWTDICKNLDVEIQPLENIKLDIKNKIAHIVTLINKLEQVRDSFNDKVKLDDNDITDIDSQIEEKSFMDAESASYKDGKVTLHFDEVKEVSLWNHLSNGMEILKEWTQFIFSFMLEQMRKSLEDIAMLIKGILTWDADLVFNKSTAWIFIYIFAFMFLALTRWASGGEIMDVDNIIADWLTISTSYNQPVIYRYLAQGTSTKVDAIKKNMRFISIRSFINNNEVVDFCQTLVSGKRLLLPWHVVGDKPVCKIYKDWDAYLRREIEYDEVPLKVLEAYPEYDTCVCELDKIVIPLYKLCKSAFGDGCMDQGDLNFVNCYHELQLSGIGGYNVNKEDIVVRSLKGTVSFLKETGLNYNISKKGLCGSLIVSSSQGVAAMHVAGNEDNGFAIMYPKSIRDKIAGLMLTNVNKGGIVFDLKEVGSEFSGARLKYEDGITTSVPLKTTSFSKTLLHASINDDMKEIMQVLDVRPKAPPNFQSLGTPRDTLQKLSQKSFMPVGTVNNDELEYAKKVLDSFLIDFDDMPMEDAVFGDTDLEKMKKDSSNGYGWKESKEELFDFENKIISDSFLDVFNEFKLQCEMDSVNIKHILAKETFKDELRAEHKVDIPRTFRVLPVQHIVGTKMCIGNLMKHIRKNMWVNGIAIGMNPYKDWDRLYTMLTECSVVFDIDFGKWDGKVHPLLQDSVNEVVLNRYKGKNKKLFEVILNSIVRGYVLVADKLYATTHSLPSGTWVTTLFNSFMNKMVSAMSFYRSYKKDKGCEPSVKQFYELVDFCMGDDKLCGARKRNEKYFNALTVQDVASDLGMDCTDGNKNKIDKPGVDIRNLVFLKRNFSYHPILKRVMCPLSKETILNTLQWYDKTKDLDVVMNGKIISVQIEAYIHSPKFKDELFRVCKEVYPLAPFFEDTRILEILDADYGYSHVMCLLGKFEEK